MYINEGYTIRNFIHQIHKYRSRLQARIYFKQKHVDDCQFLVIVPLNEGSNIGLIIGDMIVFEVIGNIE